MHSLSQFRNFTTNTSHKTHTNKQNEYRHDRRAPSILYMAAFIVIWTLVSFRLTNSLVNKATNGILWYCNDNPSTEHPLSTLSERDAQRIGKLKQVQVITRHGSRTHHHDFQRYFPDSEQFYHCNISTITSRIELPSNELFPAMLTTYEDGNQYLKQSNCEHVQSMPSLIEQHTQNAQMLIDAFMSSDSPSHLFDIGEATAQRMRFYSSNFERCKLSTMAIAARLLNISSSNASIEPSFETIVNDQAFNPYTPYENSVCKAQPQFQEWLNRSAVDRYEKYFNPRRQSVLDQQTEIIAEYKTQGGMWFDNTPWDLEHAGFQIALYYCNGFDIPLENETFWTLMDAGLQWISVQPNATSDDAFEREYATKQQCATHFMALPMYKRIFDEMSAVIDGNDDAKQFVLHSAHDSTIEAFLSGLGMYDGVFPYFAQFVTFELYSNIDGDGYLFRITNKGEFVPYEFCADEYRNGDTQLCDLEILMRNGFADVNVTQRDWAEQRCATMLDDCVCGICNDNATDNASTDSWTLEGASFVIGSLNGLILAVLIAVALKKCPRPIEQCKDCLSKCRRRDTSPSKPMAELLPVLKVSPRHITSPRC